MRATLKGLDPEKKARNQYGTGEGKCKQLRDNTPFLGKD
jgi:hypothetical protein